MRLKFKGSVKNAGFVAANVVNDANLPYHWMRPKNYTPPLYLPATLGASAFFCKVDVSINGHMVEGPVMDETSFLWKHVNRLFCKEDICMEK